MTLPLTERQEQLWLFIKSCKRSPTHDEMAKALGYRSRGQRTTDLLNALERKGYVRREKGNWRSVVATDPSLEYISTDELRRELARRLLG